MKFDNKYCRCSKAFFTMLTVSILLIIVVIPAVNARPPSPLGGKGGPIKKDKSGIDFGVLWWTAEGLENAEADIKGLKDALNNMANSNLRFDDNNVYTVYPEGQKWGKELFIKEELGGYDIIDTAEFVYYVGHGNGGSRSDFENLNWRNSLVLGKNANDKWIKVYPYECSWGEKAKVVALGCCFGTEGGFAKSMDGVYLTLGTSTWMDDAIFGEELGPSLTHMTCKQAWFDTQIRKTESNDLVARILGENTTVGDYSLGDNSGDIVVDNTITYWTCPINWFEPLQYPSDSGGGCNGGGNLDSAQKEQNNILILTNNNQNQNVDTGSTDSNGGGLTLTTGSGADPTIAGTSGSGGSSGAAGSNGNPSPAGASGSGGSSGITGISGQTPQSAGTSASEPIVPSGIVVSGTAVIGGSSKEKTGTEGDEPPVGEPDTTVITTKKTATKVSEPVAVVKSLLNKISSVSKSSTIGESEPVSKTTTAISISNDVSSTSKSTTSISGINRVNGIRSVNPNVKNVKKTNGQEADELIDDEGGSFELDYNVCWDMSKAFPTNRKSNVGLSSSYARLVAQDYYKKNIDSLDKNEIYSIKVVPQKMGYCYKAFAKEEQAYKDWTIAYNVFIIKDLVNKKDIDDGGSNGGGNIDGEESQSYSGSFLTGGGGDLRGVRGNKLVSKTGTAASAGGGNIQSSSKYRKTTLIIGAGPTVCYKFSRITNKEHEDQKYSPCYGQYTNQNGNNGGNSGNLIGVIQQAISLVLNEGGLS